MAISPGFEDLFALRCRNRALRRRVEELESGGAYAELKEQLGACLRAHAAEVKRLKAEIGEGDRALKAMRREWFRTFEQVQREHEAELRRAGRAADAAAERALAAERRVDELLDGRREDARLIRELEAEIEELKGRNAKLTAQVNRDFENSSVPSSAQGPARKKIPNTRAKTGRRPGGQPGHPHHPRKRPAPTRSVRLEDPAGFAEDPDLYETGKAIAKLVVSASIAVEVTEYAADVWRRRSNGSRLHAPFPDGVADEVTYDGSVKALAFLLTHECCASAAKAKAFLREASRGKLDLSTGMISQLASEFSAKSEPERREAVAKLMSAPVMHADFTNANVGGEGRQVLILANEGASMMIARESKGHRGVEGTPLAGYVGCAVHDHDTTFYSYGTSHQECMQHNVRYLVGSVQNEPHLAWNGDMLELLRKMIRWRNSIDPADPPGEGELEEVRAAFATCYDAILEHAAREYEKSPPTKYYRDGYNLFRRLRDFRESELRFLYDLGVPHENSLCERLARVFKRKQRQAIAFRSFEYLGYACDAIACVSNMRLEGRDVFAEASAIFDRPKPATARPRTPSAAG